MDVITALRIPRECDLTSRGTKALYSTATSYDRRALLSYQTLMELGRHGGVSDDTRGEAPEAELISEAAKRAHANKQKRDRAKRRKQSMYQAGEAPHPQHQKIQKISGDACLLQEPY